MERNLYGIKTFFHNCLGNTYKKCIKKSYKQQYFQYRIDLSIRCHL